MRKSYQSILFIAVFALASCSFNQGNSSSLPTVYYQALGAEPRWSVEVLTNSILFYSEDFDQKQQFDIIQSDDGEFMSYNNADKTQQFSLVLEEKICMDKLTAQEMRFSATFTFGDITYLGCAQQIDN